MRRRPLLLLVLSLLLLLGAYATVLGVRASRSGLTWAEMDLNRDGTTELGEVLEAGDIATRPVTIAGQRCTEWFRLKDGLTVKQQCPAS